MNHETRDAYAEDYLRFAFQRFGEKSGQFAVSERNMGFVQVKLFAQQVVARLRGLLSDCQQIDTLPQSCDLLVDPLCFLEPVSRGLSLRNPLAPGQIHYFQYSFPVLRFGSGRSIHIPPLQQCDLDDSVASGGGFVDGGGFCLSGFDSAFHYSKQLVQRLDWDFC